MSEDPATHRRSGARRMADVPQEVLASLEKGEAETLNLMEWLAVDMAALARVCSSQQSNPRLKRNLLIAAGQMAGRGITSRLRVAGHAIALASGSAGEAVAVLGGHKSDIVRQWACYAVNDSALSLPIEQRLMETLPFAADQNMSVREAAWMAFRPHLAENFERTLPLLGPIADAKNENIRRFSIEVTRPRSVWGAHLSILKRAPWLAESLLERVRADGSRYVRLAAGNWLNDASKTQAEWVMDLCRRWSTYADARTDFIIRRGLRTIATNAKEECESQKPYSCDSGIATFEPMENAL